MSKPRVLILRAAGTNCDLETEAAFEMAGAQPARVHINAILDGKEKLREYDILCIPGGFSYGDYISSGRVLANEVKKITGLKEFVSSGKPVLGICNGFQVLVKAGFLPGGKNVEQTASLTTNASGRFECRWSRIKVSQVSFFTRGMPEYIELPVAHGEGRFVADDDVLDKVEKQVALRYEDNPSGSMRGIAGIVNAKGNVFGLMPHPERFLTPHHHPFKMDVPENALGLQIIRNCVQYAKG